MLKNGLFIWSIAVIFLASSLVNAGVIDRISDAIKKISFNWSSASTNFSSQGKVPMSTLDTGKTFLQQHNIISARDTFKTIVQGDPTNQEAQFLYAITRLAALYEDTNLQSVGGYNSVRKIMEDLGVVFSNYGLYNTRSANEVNNYPHTSPRTGLMQDFLDKNLLPEIDAAIDNLNAINQNFAGSVLHASAFGDTNNASLLADYADVLILKSMLYFAKSMLNLSYAYNFDISIPDVFNGDRSEYYKIRTLFKNHPDFLRPKTALASRLAIAKQALINAIDTFKDGATRIKQRAGQGNRLFVIDVPYSANAYYKNNSKQTDVDLSISALDEIKDSLNNGQRTFIKTAEYFKLDQETLNDTARMTLDISKLFNSQIDFRSKLADINGDIFISDYTFGGIAPNGLPRVHETITLLPGWNMVSFAMLPNDRSVANVLAPIAGKYSVVWGYDTQTGWKMYIPNYSDNTLTHFEAGKGYWIYATT